MVDHAWVGHSATGVAVVSEWPLTGGGRRRHRCRLLASVGAFDAVLFLVADGRSRRATPPVGPAGRRARPGLLARRSRPGRRVPDQDAAPHPGRTGRPGSWPRPSSLPAWSAAGLGVGQALGRPARRPLPQSRVHGGRRSGQLVGICRAPHPSDRCRPPGRPLRGGPLTEGAAELAPSRRRDRFDSLAVRCLDPSRPRCPRPFCPLPTPAGPPTR